MPKDWNTDAYNALKKNGKLKDLTFDDFALKLKSNDFVDEEGTVSYRDAVFKGVNKYKVTKNPLDRDRFEEMTDRSISTNEESRGRPYITSQEDLLRASQEGQLVQPFEEAPLQPQEIPQGSTITVPQEAYGEPVVGDATVTPEAIDPSLVTPPESAYDPYQDIIKAREEKINAIELEKSRIGNLTVADRMAVNLQKSTDESGVLSVTQELEEELGEEAGSIQNGIKTLFEQGADYSQIGDFLLQYDSKNPAVKEAAEYFFEEAEYQSDDFKKRREEREAEDIEKLSGINEGVAELNSNIEGVNSWLTVYSDTLFDDTNVEERKNVEGLLQQMLNKRLELEGDRRDIVSESDNPYLGMDDNQRKEAMAKENYANTAINSTEEFFKLYGIDEMVKGGDKLSFNQQDAEVVIDNTESMIEELASTDPDLYAKMQSMTPQEQVKQYLIEKIYPELQYKLKNYKDYGGVGELMGFMKDSDGTGLESLFERMDLSGVKENGDIDPTENEIRSLLGQAFVAYTMGVKGIDPGSVFGHEADDSSATGHALESGFTGLMEAERSVADILGLEGAELYGTQVRNDLSFRDTASEYINKISQETGIPLTDASEDLNDPSNKERFAETTKMLAQIGGEFYAGGRILKGATALGGLATKAGGLATLSKNARVAGLATRLGRVNVGLADKVFSSLKTLEHVAKNGSFSGRLLAKTALMAGGAIEEGVKYEVIGQMMDQEEGTFTSGAVGHTASSIMQGFLKLAPGGVGTKIVKLLGPALGETAEEVGQEISQQGLDDFYKHISDPTEAAWFFGTTMTMGALMGGDKGKLMSDWTNDMISSGDVSPEIIAKYEKLTGIQEFKDAKQEIDDQKSVEDGTATLETQARNGIREQTLFDKEMTQRIEAGDQEALGDIEKDVLTTITTTKYKEDDGLGYQVVKEGEAIDPNKRGITPSRVQEVANEQKRRYTQGQPQMTSGEISEFLFDNPIDASSQYNEDMDQGSRVSSLEKTIQEAKTERFINLEKELLGVEDLAERVRLKDDLESSIQSRKSHRHSISKRENRVADVSLTGGDIDALMSEFERHTEGTTLSKSKDFASRKVLDSRRQLDKFEKFVEDKYGAREGKEESVVHAMDRRISKGGYLKNDTVDSLFDKKTGIISTFVRNGGNIQLLEKYLVAKRVDKGGVNQKISSKLEEEIYRATSQSVTDTRARIAELEEKLLSASNEESVKIETKLEDLKIKLEESKSEKLKTLEGKIGNNIGLSEEEAGGVISEVEATGNIDQYESTRKYLYNEVNLPTLNLLLESQIINREAYDNIVNSEGEYYTPVKQTDDLLYSIGAEDIDGGTDKKLKEEGGNKIQRGVIRPLAKRLGFGKKEGALLESPIQNLVHSRMSAIDAASNNKNTLDFVRVLETFGLVDGENFTIKPDFGKGDPKGIPFFKDGSRQVLTIKDEKLRKVFESSRTNKDLSAVLNVFSTVGGHLRSLFTTHNPFFAVTNFLRDLQAASGRIQSLGVKGSLNEYRKSSSQGAKGLRDIKKGIDSQEAKWVKEAQEHGGWITYADYVSGERKFQDLKNRMETGQNRYQGTWGTRTAIKTVDLGKVLSDGVANLNERLEMRLRMGAYIQARKEGMTPNQASHVAKEVTVNFDKRGEWTKWMNPLFMFSNAQFQGNYNVYKSIKGSRRARYMAGMYITHGIMEEVFNSYFTDDEEDEGISDEHKKRNMTIMNPFSESKDDYLNIPLAGGFSALKYAGNLIGQASMGKLSLEDGFSKVRDLMVDEATPLQGSTLLQRVVPTALDPIAQHYENKNWSGFDIYKKPSKYSDDKVLSSMPDDRSSMLAVGLAKTFNKISGGDDYNSGFMDAHPRVYDHYRRSYLGGSGQIVFDAMQSFAKMYAGDEEVLAPWDNNGMSPESIKELPGVGTLAKKFFKEGDPVRTKINALYDIKSNSLNHEFDDAELDRVEDLMDYIQEHEGMDFKKLISIKNSIRNNQLKIKTARELGVHVTEL